VDLDVTTDRVRLDGVDASPRVADRTLRFLREVMRIEGPVHVESDNDFPTGAGLASSASGFAALTLAAAGATGTDLDPTRLSGLARRGSGSASRSVFGGLVVWDRGSDPEGRDSVARSIATAGDWDLRMVVAVVDDGPKGVGSTEGMTRSRDTSPLYQAWVAGAQAMVDAAEDAVARRDLEALGTLMERSTFAMHGTMHSATPPLIYWRGGTVDLLHRVFELRADGISAWATMDAGPQVKVLCTPDEAERVAAALRPLALRVVTLAPGGPARLVDP